MKTNDGYTPIRNLIVEKKKNQIRISPIKNNNQGTRKSFYPFSSSIIKDKKKIITKQEILKMNSKLQLIKSKCMNINALHKTDSRKTLQSGWISDQDLIDSQDLDSQNDINTTNNTYKNKITLIRSLFPDRPSTIFFHYPKCCAIENQSILLEDRIYNIEHTNLTYKINGSDYRCIINSLQFNGFNRCQSGNEWNIFFDMSGTHLKVLENMKHHQKMNHFPGCWNIGRKDFMWKHLNKQRRNYPEIYNFIPITYLLPTDYQRFQIIRENAQKQQLWIMKPANQACGRGIKLITRDSKVKNKKDIIISQYISNPHLINQHKYDLRIYILVTSYDPLRIYMFQEGLVRFATYQYTNKLKDVRKRYIHLTNFSVNKYSKKFVKNTKVQQDGHGSKWSITALKKYYNSINIDANKLFQDIKDVIIKTCISTQPFMLDIHSKTQQKRNCGFQIYGFDILIDDQLKPWLMQVNVCPSLSSSSPMDRKIKHTLLTDTLNTIGLQYLSRKNQQLVKKREKQRLLHRQERKYYARNLNNLQNLNYNNCLEILSPQDWLILFQSQQEINRSGHFENIFPIKNTIDSYQNLFEFPRYNNHMLWKFIKSDRKFINRLYQ